MRQIGRLMPIVAETDEFSTRWNSHAEIKSAKFGRIASPGMSVVFSKAGAKLSRCARWRQRICRAQPGRSARVLPHRSNRLLLIAAGCKSQAPSRWIKSRGKCRRPNRVTDTRELSLSTVAQAPVIVRVGPLPPHSRRFRFGKQSGYPLPVAICLGCAKCRLASLFRRPAADRFKDWLDETIRLPAPSSPGPVTRVGPRSSSSRSLFA